MKWFDLTVIALFLSISFLSASEKTITCASEEWEEYTNRDGSGFYWDLIRHVYAQSGYTLKTVTAPYSRTIRMVDYGHADCWVGSYKKEQPFAHYPEIAFDYDEVSALMLKSEADSIQNLQSLEGKKVGWMLEYNYEKYFNLKFTTLVLNNRTTAYMMVKRKDLDVFLDDATEIKNSLKELGFNFDDFAIKPLFDLPLYLGFSPNEEGRKLAKTWDGTMKKLHETGELKRLYIDADATDYYPF